MTISYQPQHPSSMLHAHCHSLLWLVFRNGNVLRLIFVLWFCSVSGFWTSIMPCIWSCYPLWPTWPSFGFLFLTLLFLSSKLSDTVTSLSLCLGFPPMVWAASVSEGSFGAEVVSERRCERPGNGLPPSSALIHFWTCNKTRLRQPAWLVRAHRWGYRKPPPHCWDSARLSCPRRERRREGEEGTWEEEQQN